MDNQTLIDKIIKLRQAYWDGNPVASDEEYDELIEALREVDPNNKILTQVEHGGVAGQTIKHETPMLSLEKVYDDNGVFAWMKRTARNEDEVFIIQPKYDGISCHYKDGIYATRGDGVVGQNITEVCTAICVHEEEGSCQKDFYGEIVIKKSDFTNIFSNITRSDGSTFKNPRNAVAGILSNDSFQSYVKQGARLTLIDHNRFSFKTTLKQVSIKWPIIKSMIENLDYPMDGIVIKLEDKAYSEFLGYTSHHPKGQIAFKFANQSETTELIGIEYGMGREQITATAIFKPIEIGGVTITRAVVPMKSSTLPCIINGDFMEGTELVVERAGDVIPHIVEVKNVSSGKCFTIDRCPYCGASLDVGENSVVCSNANCEEKQFQKLYNGLRELDMKSVGDSTVRKVVQFIKNDCGSNFSIDLNSWFKLITKPHIRALLYHIPGFGGKSVNNFLDEMARIRKTTTEKFIASLCIPGVGTKIATEIMAVMTLDDLYTASESTLSTIPSIGNTMANRIVRYFTANKDYLIDLRSRFMFENKVSNNNPVSSYKGTVCFTGAMRLQRKDMEVMARNKGYAPADSVSRGLTLLVVADGEPLTSSKCKKALSYGVKIISESDFIQSA